VNARTPSPETSGDSARSTRRRGLTRPCSQFDLVLVLGIAGMALGLAMVTASLAPPSDGPHVSAPEWRRGVLPAPGVPGLRSIASRYERAQPAGASLQRVDFPAPAAFPRVSATGPWKSPLYPQNGVTLWDRIRVSSQRDLRAYLLDTAIQIHAPATAATPGPRPVVPPCCPRS